jgi:hypothetical protein
MLSELEIRGVYTCSKGPSPVFFPFFNWLIYPLTNLVIGHFLQYKLPYTFNLLTLKQRDDLWFLWIEKEGLIDWLDPDLKDCPFPHRKVRSRGIPKLIQVQRNLTNQLQRKFRESLMGAGIFSHVVYDLPVFAFSIAYPFTRFDL